MKLLITPRALLVLLSALGISVVFYITLPNFPTEEYRGLFDGFPVTAIKNVPVYFVNVKEQIDNKLLKILEDSEVRPFLIEPRILLNLLNVQDLELLTKREVDITQFSRDNTVTSYGIFEKDSAHIDEKLIKHLKSQGYNYASTNNVDARQFHWDENKNRNVSIVSHHFITKDSKVAHLVVFYARNLFFWFPEITKLPSTVHKIINSSQLSFGHHAAAFELFNITSSNLSSIHPLKVPSDPLYFIFEIPSSQFLECNYQVAREFYSKNTKENEPDEKFDKKVSDAILLLKHLVRPFLISFWICSGTLLGWYRQCDVIPYTTDADFAAWSHNIDPVFHDYAQKKRDDLILKIVYGLPEESFQYAFYYSGLRVDFFFTYKGTNSYWYGGHRPGQNVYFHYIYPKFTLCSGELLGHKVLVPCSPKEVISAEYGEGWTKPVKSWSYDSSAYNLGPKEHWPKDIKKKTYQEI